MFDREHLCDRATGRVSDEMGALDAERIHQADHIRRHTLDGVADAALIALPDAAMIEGHDLEPLGESGDLVLPKRCEPAKPGDEQD